MRLARALAVQAKETTPAGHPAELSVLASVVEWALLGVPLRVKIRALFWKVGVDWMSVCW